MSPDQNVETAVCNQTTKSLLYLFNMNKPAACDRPCPESDKIKSEREGTLNSIDIPTVLTEELVPISGTRFSPNQSICNQSHHCHNTKSMKENVDMFRSCVIALICTLLKAVLAYSLVLRSNLSCVQRTYIGLWRPNEHCDY